MQKWASAFRCKQNLFSFWPEKQNKNENCFCQTFRGKGLIFAGVNESLPHSHLENTRVVFFATLYAHEPIARSHVLSMAETRA